MELNDRQSTTITDTSKAMPKTLPYPISQAAMWDFYEDDQYANISPEVLAAAKVLAQLGGVRGFGNVDLKDPEHDSAEARVEAAELGGLDDNMDTSKSTTYEPSKIVIGKRRGPTMYETRDMHEEETSVRATKKPRTIKVSPQSPRIANGYLGWSPASKALDVTEMTEEQLATFRAQKHRNTTVRGHRCIEDGTVDRGRAYLNNPRPDLLMIRFREEWDDPAMPGKFIKGDDYITHVYKHEIDWRCEKSVSQLNSWRSQIIRRCVGCKYPNDRFWTIEERDILVGIVRKHHEEADIIDWATIAKEYNTRIKCMFQESGCMGAPRQYCVPDSKRQAFLPSLPLKLDRFVSQREAHELRQEMTYFRDTSAASVVAAIRSSAQMEINYEFIKPGTKRKIQKELNDFPGVPKDVQHSSLVLNSVSRAREATRIQNRQEACELRSTTDLRIPKLTRAQSLPVQRAPPQSDFHFSLRKRHQE